MHEMSLIRNVVDLAVETCRECEGKRVRNVRLAIGELRDFVDEFAVGLFERLARDTEAAGARLEITRVPATGRCRSCGSSIRVDPFAALPYTCPCCAAEENFVLVSGTEFMVLDMEIEATVPDMDSDRLLMDRV